MTMDRTCATRWVDIQARRVQIAQVSARIQGRKRARCRDNRQVIDSMMTGDNGMNVRGEMRSRARDAETIGERVSRWSREM